MADQTYRAETNGLVNDPEKERQMTKRILLAEDGKETQAVVRQILVGEGFDVKAVGTGTDAVNALAHGTFHAAILDLGLPDVSGLDVLKRLRAGGSKIPVIVISGQDDHPSSTIQQNAQGYLTKPFTLEALRVQIERWI
jgi:DNA-binding response OmpR family regulator